ncbi:MAG TPA: stalk domain-containing protein [Pseudobacteroides sp.]|uniref:stalk domain-containing protein n=1 Tax=Pseudobacteroides sp. TaxID=1968840 RepID=UPI002F92D644
MKNIRIKIISGAALAVLIFSSLIVFKSQAFAETGNNGIKVAIDEKFLTFDVAPTVVSGRTMVPLRVIFEGLGASVTWDDKTKTVIGKKQGKTVKLTINNKNAYVNGKLIKIDVPPKVISGRTLVPTRFIAESLGTDVYWEEKAKIVSIIPPKAIKFSDAKLESAIRAALKKTTGSITTTDAKKVKTLNLENKGITNIEGLQYFRGLTELNLIENKVKDIMKLGSLTELKTLKMDKNRVYDISPLKYLTKLTVVWIQENHVKDLSPLKELTGMRGLVLTYNQIFDISPLANMKKLDYLYIAGNPITDINILKGLKNINKLIFEDYTNYKNSDKIDQQLFDKYNKLENKVKEIIANVIKPEMTELEKEMALHDYIVTHVRYDMENFKKNTIPANRHTVYGALIENSAVCDGYARSLQLLLNRVGIESIMVTGNTDNINGSVDPKRTLHAWNIVKINGAYYQVDPTFDDRDLENGRSDITYYYFNLSDKQMGLNYIWDREAYPQCTTDGAVFDLQNREKRNAIVTDNQYFFINDKKNIIKKSFDGKKTNVGGDKANQILLHGDWIYYINETDGNNIYKIKTDGTSRSKLGDGKANEIEIAGESIYYIKDNKIWRMNLDGSNQSTVNSDVSALWVDIIGETMYYKVFNYGIGGRLVKSDLNGNNRVDICSDEPAGFVHSSNGGASFWYRHNEHIVGDWIYYINAYDQKSIYKIKTDGTERTKITADSVMDNNYPDINIVDNYIYYRNASDGDKLYRIKADGTNRQALE